MFVGGGDAFVANEAGVFSFPGRAFFGDGAAMTISSSIVDWFVLVVDLALPRFHGGISFGSREVLLVAGFPLGDACVEAGARAVLGATSVTALLLL